MRKILFLATRIQVKFLHITWTDIRGADQKKPKRVAGLIHACFIAITASSLIERQVRKSMVEEKILEPPPLPEERTTKTPTAMRILEAFSDLCWYEFEGTKEQAAFPIKLSALQKKLLRLLGLPENFYN